MKRASNLVLLVFVLAILTPFGFSQAQASNYDPRSQQRPAVRRDSFLDFTLARFNPENKDYGQCFSEGRIVLLHETMNDGYFWSNVVALALLCCFLAVIIYQKTVLTRREWSTTEVLTQFEQALGGCQAQLTLAFQKNRELAEMLATSREVATRVVPFPIPSAEQVVSSSAATRLNTPKATPSTAVTSSAAKTEDRHQPTAPKPTQPTNQMRLFSPDADLIMRVNSLEQQLAHSQRDNHALRQRIANGRTSQSSDQQRNHPAKEAQPS